MTSNSIVSRIFDPQQANAPRTRFSRLRRVPLVRPDLQALYQDAGMLPRFVHECPVAMRYLRLLGPLSWSRFPERDLRTNWGAPTMPYVPFVAACLVKLDQRLAYMSHLRQYLVEHPALAWVLGFPLVPSSRYPWGFDVDASLPTQRHLARLLRRIPNASLQFLLDDTVYLLRDELVTACKDFGRAISLDTKHILAWVKENNPKAYLKAGRYHKDKQPSGDPDCRLGCKRRRNQRASSKDPPPTPVDNPVPADTISVGEYHWGYASGVVATKVFGWGEFALAELTQPFDCSDVSYFSPLMADVERRLGFKPPFGALDAAYDSFYVYEYFHQAGGFAAVPLVKKGGHSRTFDPNGLPLCKAGLSMPLKFTFQARKGVLVPHQKGRYVCPLLFPQPTGRSCPIDDPHWPKGGCKTTLATSIGARIRHQLDRNGETYAQLYKQRTASERIFSQAVALGIERPKLRNGAAITNRNTLIYVLLNLRALQRVRQQKLNRRLEL